MSLLNSHKINGMGCTVQPIGSADRAYLMTLGIDGIDHTPAVKIYSHAPLDARGDNDADGQIIEWQGELFVVVSCQPFKSLTINHYRSYAVKYRGKQSSADFGDMHSSFEVL